MNSWLRLLLILVTAYYCAALVKCLDHSVVLVSGLHPQPANMLQYCRADLLTIGKYVISRTERLRVSPECYTAIRNLGICNIQSTFRGNRGGRSKHRYMNERPNQVQGPKTISGTHSPKCCLINGQSISKN